MLSSDLIICLQHIALDILADIQHSKEMNRLII